MRAAGRLIASPPLIGLQQCSLNVATFNTSASCVFSWFVCLSVCLLTEFTQTLWLNFRIFGKGRVLVQQTVDQIFEVKLSRPRPRPEGNNTAHPICHLPLCDMAYELARCSFASWQFLSTAVCRINQSSNLFVHWVDFSHNPLDSIQSNSLGLCIEDSKLF